MFTMGTSMAQNGTAFGQGASQGAQYGPWGALIGGIAGGANDIIGQIGQAQSDHLTTKRLKNYANQLKSQYDEGVSNLDDYKTEQEGNYADYNDALANADWDTAGTINFDKDSYNRDDYRKSNEQSIKDATQASVMGTNMGTGDSWGSGALSNMITAGVNQQQDLDEYADNQMNKQMQFDYGVAKDDASNRVEALKNSLNSQAQIAQNKSSLTDNYYNGKFDLMNNYNSGINSLDQYRIANGYSEDSSLGNMFANFFGGGV